MEYTTLGRTGLKVSVAGLGCGGFSRLGMRTGKTEDEAVAMIHAALDLGVNLLDTAPPYGTEAVVGKALKAYRAIRWSSPPRPGHRNDERYTPERVVASLDNSLRALGTDYIDVFQLHGVAPARLRLLRETHRAGAAARRRSKGKFRFLGITEHSLNDFDP